MRLHEKLFYNAMKMAMKFFDDGQFRKTQQSQFSIYFKSNRICKNVIHHMTTQMFFVSSKTERNFIVSNGFSFLQRNQTLERNKKKTLFLSKHHLLFAVLNCYIFNRVMNYNGQCNLFY